MFHFRRLLLNMIIASHFSWVSWVSESQTQSDIVDTLKRHILAGTTRIAVQIVKIGQEV